MTWTEPELLWMAGLLEGEGSFLIKSGTDRPIVSCHMTDLDVLERLQKLAGGKIYPSKSTEQHHKECWVWNTTKIQESVHLMRALYPHMGQRRSKAISDCLEHRDGFEVKRSQVDKLRQERNSEILNLRRQGLTYRQIGDRTNCSRETANKVVNASMKANN